MPSPRSPPSPFLPPPAPQTLIPNPLPLRSVRLERAKRDEAEAARNLANLEAANKDRLDSRARIQAALAHSEKQVASFIQASSVTARKAVHHYATHTAAYISASLEAERGYSTKPGTTSPARVMSTGGKTGGGAMGTTAGSSTQVRIVGEVGIQGTTYLGGAVRCGATKQCVGWGERRYNSSPLTPTPRW